jgi:DNA invertase Pin-like site-specific DNA recombinase
MRAAIYVRVSTENQSTEMQEVELKEYLSSKRWQLKAVYRDNGVSGRQIGRPGLDALWKDCRKRRFDVVLVWRFDRFARSVEQLARALTEFEELGINFVSIKESIDTTTSAGRVVFYVMAALAAFEREIIAERVRSGLANAKSKGVRLGRPPRTPLTPEIRKQIRQQYASGKWTMRRLAEQYGTTVWTVHQLARG